MTDKCPTRSSPESDVELARLLEAMQPISESIELNWHRDDGVWVCVLTNKYGTTFRWGEGATPLEAVRACWEKGAN